MKANLLLIGASVMIILASCNSTRQATSGTSDDVYVTRTESTPPPPTIQQGTNDQSGSTNQGGSYDQSNSGSEQNKESDGSSYNNSTYNDYGNDGGWYSSQMNRWYNPYAGFGYYSPCYTGFGFYDPFYYSPGLSISIGFGFGGFHPYYDPFYPWYSPFGYYPYYGYGYNPYWYNPYYPGYGGYGYGNDYGYGYGGNNSYYGYHGASSGNTSGSSDGRHYKMGDGESGGTPDQPIYNRGQFSGNQNGRGDVKRVEITGSNLEKNAVKRDNQGTPKKDNSPVIDRNHAAPDRNMSVPERNNNSQQHNGTQPRQNNGQNPRKANFSQILIQQSGQQSSNNYHPPYIGQNEVVMNDQSIEQWQKNYSSQQSQGNFHQPLKQDQKMIYGGNKNNSSSKSSTGSQKHVESYQKQPAQVSHESVKQSAPQQRSDGGARGNSQSAGQPASRGNHGGGNHNPR